MTTVALIPVKDLDRAKARLADVLDAAGRRALTLAVVRDVLDATLACTAIDRVALVTRDAEVLALASAAGATGLLEPGGLNEALTSAAAGVNAARVVVLAGDLPLVRADDIAIVARADADVVVASSLDGGTNAVALTPGAIPFRFGPDSATRHLAAASDAGLRAQRIEIPALALDIDTPDDLTRLRDTIDRGETAGAHTLAALRQLGLVPQPTKAN